MRLAELRGSRPRCAACTAGAPSTVYHYTIRTASVVSTGSLNELAKASHALFCNDSKEVEKFSHLVWLEWSDHHITCKIGATRMFLITGVRIESRGMAYLMAVVLCRRSFAACKVIEENR